MKPSEYLEDVKEREEIARRTLQFDDSACDVPVLLAMIEAIHSEAQHLGSVTRASMERIIQKILDAEESQ